MTATFEPNNDFRNNIELLNYQHTLQMQLLEAARFKKKYNGKIMMNPEVNQTMQYLHDA